MMCTAPQHEARHRSVAWNVCVRIKCRVWVGSWRSLRCSRWRDSCLAQVRPGVVRGATPAAAEWEEGAASTTASASCPTPPKRTPANAPGAHGMVAQQRPNVWPFLAGRGNIGTWDTLPQHPHQMLSKGKHAPACLSFPCDDVVGVSADPSKNSIWRAQASSNASARLNFESASACFSSHLDFA